MTTQQLDALIKQSGKYVSRIEWLAPRLAWAKNRDIKLSNNNLKKLESLYVSWYIDTYGPELGFLNATFRAVYSEMVPLMIPSVNPLLALIGSDATQGSFYYQPVIVANPEASNAIPDKAAKPKRWWQK